MDIKPTITYDDFAKLDLRLATILSAERIEKSDKLLKLQVSLGENTRQVIAGIGKSYEPIELIGKKVVILTNLEPRSLMGEESQGMILAGGGEIGQVSLLSTTDDLPDGTSVR